MLIRRSTTTLLEIFCYLSIYSQDISKSMKIADDIPGGTHKCEWVNYTSIDNDTFQGSS